MAVAPANFYATTGANVALTAATAQHVIGIKSAANSLIKLCEIGIGFDATDATKGPVLVELMKVTNWGSYSPGQTGTSTITPVLVSGQYGTTSPTLAARAWGTNSVTTANTILEASIDSNKGQLIIQYPLGREPEGYNGNGFTIRCTSVTGSTPNVRAWMSWEE